MLAESGVCTEEEKKKCAYEFGENLQWACSNCKKNRDENEISPYTAKLLRIRALQAAGYPLKANDLTMEEWLDLAEIEFYYRQREIEAWQTKAK